MSHQFDHLFTSVGAAVAAHRGGVEETPDDHAARLAHFVALRVLDETGRAAHRIAATKMARRWAVDERRASQLSLGPGPSFAKSFVASVACNLKHALPAGETSLRGSTDAFKALAVLAATCQQETLRGGDALATGRALVRVGFVHAAAVSFVRLLGEPKWAEVAESDLAELLTRLPPDSAKLALLNSAAAISRLPPLLEVHREATKTYLGSPGASAQRSAPAPALPGAEATSHHLASRLARVAGDDERECREISNVLDALSRSAKPDTPIRAYYLPDIVERTRVLGRRDLQRRAVELTLIGRRGGTEHDRALIRPALETIRVFSAPAVIPSEPASPALILISQIQRSGGSLLAQLFDGHPGLLAMPHELRINDPKWEWPQINLDDDPLSIFERMFNDRYPLFIARGYSKADGNQAAEKDRRGFPLDYPQFVEGFVRRLGADRPTSRRAVLDAYFSSFAAAWAGAGSRPTPSHVTAFAPRLNMSVRTCKLFFEDYPDGHFITIVRDPLSWFASARRHEPEYSDVRAATDLWKLSTYASLALANSQPHRVTVLLYADLIQNLDAAIALLCRRVGIDDHATLRMPTFLAEPILSNSSFQASEYGVRKEGLERWRSELAPAEHDHLTAEAAPLYDHVAALYSLSSGSRTA